MTKDEKDDAMSAIYLEANGWRAVLRDEPHGLWTSIHGTMRRKEAIDRQLLIHTTSFLYWTEHAPTQAKSLASTFIFANVMGELGKMAADPS